MTEEFDGSPLAWLKRVLETQEEEIDCSECLDLVSQYVDLELETGQAAARMPALIQHLNQCQACWESYQMLRELARLEGQDRLPTLQELVEHLKRER